jgi:tRNA-Thr(GGU) m(6)t(6)A37 methyltransferase TsaA
MRLRPIGYVRTAHADGADVPSQATANSGETGELDVLPEFASGLRGLEGFDYAWLISWFDRVGSELAALEVVPHPLRETGQTFGVFATRAPTRPNAIGLSQVRILGIEGAKVRFAGVDLLDGTPILDIKPFMPGIDVPAEGDDVRVGWLDKLNP